MYLIYLRRSTTDENHQQYSLDAQEKICKRYAEQHGLTVAKIIHEKHSAKEAGRRPLFLQMLKDLEQGKYAGVIVHNVDRLLRSIGDFALIDGLRMKHVEFHFVDGSYPNTPEGNMMLGINVVFAKWYVEKLGREVMKGFSESLAQGKLPREAPVGYLDVGNGVKEPDPATAPLVRAAFDLYATGQWSVDDLTDEMKRRGLRTKRGQKHGKTLPPSSMHRILTNPFYMGTIRYNGKEYAGAHGPIVSQETFLKVQAILNGRQHKPLSSIPYAYRGLFRCDDCGYALSPYTKKGNVYYGCTNRKCPQTTIREDKLELGELPPELERMIMTEKELAQTKTSLRKLEGILSQQREQKRLELEGRRVQMCKELEKARELVLSEVFTRQDFEAEKERLRKEQETIEQEEQAMHRMDIKRLDDVYTFLELCRIVMKGFGGSSLERKRGTVEAAFLELTVKDKKLATAKAKPEFEVVAKRGINGDGGTDGT